MQAHPPQDLCHSILRDRGIVGIAGAQAKSFLQGLVTNDVTRVAPGEAAYAALLSPPGKILFDFLVTEASTEQGGGLYLDCPGALAPDLAKRLSNYRLRAKITVEDASARLCVAAAWGADAASWQPRAAIACFADPRATGLGRRLVLAFSEACASEAEGAALYEAHRIALGIPKGGVDFAYGEAFPHDANLDLLNGVDFKKGCYVGQEVVSRVEHRGTARKRILRVHFRGPPPAPGSEIVAGGTRIGTMGSAVPGAGLAMIRTDRAEEALAAGTPLVAGGIELALAPAE